MIEDLNKFEISEKLDELKEQLHDPEVAWFDFPENLYDEIMDMPRDKEGGVPKYYLSEGLKSILKFVDLMNKLESATSPEGDFLDDFE